MAATKTIKRTEALIESIDKIIDERLERPQLMGERQTIFDKRTQRFVDLRNKIDEALTDFENESD